jgi:hypothetical protein
MAICEASVGILIIVIVSLDVFQVVIVPRQSPRTLRIAALIIRLFWLPWRQLSLHAGMRHEYFLAKLHLFSGKLLQLDRVFESITERKLN